MGSTRAPIVVAVVAAGLWLLVLLTASPPPAAPDARVKLTGLSASVVEVIELARSGPPLILRRENGVFRAGDAAVSPEAIESLLAILEFSYARRFGERRGGEVAIGLGEGQDTASLAITATGGEKTVLRRGAAVAGGELVWIGRGPDALLVTAKESSLLFPPRARLLESRPLFVGTGLQPDKLTITGADGRVFALSGRPLVVDANKARIDSGAVDSLLASLAELELEPRPMPPNGLSGTRIEVASGGRVGFVRIVGTCADDGLLVRSSLGPGCVRSAPIERAAALLDDPRPLLARLVDPSRTVLSARLETAAGALDIDMRGAGELAARRWLAALASVNEIDDVADRRAVASIVGTVVLHYADDQVDRIVLSRNRSGQRAQIEGQPISWRVPSEVGKLVLGIRAFELSSLSLSSRDPSEIRALVVNQRPVAVSAIGRIAKARLAHLEALRFVSARPAASHRLAPARLTIRVEFSPPPVETGDPRRLTIKLGASVEDGCYAQLEGKPAVFVLALETCRALESLSTR